MANLTSISRSNPIKRRRVGILGGMGPAATVDLMQKIIDATPATCDQEHVPVIVWNVPQIPPRVPAIVGVAESPEPAMREGARWLAASGAEAIVIACNTAHHWAAAVESAAQRPLIHIADAALSALSQSSARRVMLLATVGTIKTGFYAQRFVAKGLALETPDAADQESVTTAIAQVKAGRIDSARAGLVPVLQRMAEQGVDAFLLACTELPIVVRGTPFEAKSVDATEALARAIVAFSLDIDNTQTGGAILQHGDQVA